MNQQNRLKEKSVVKLQFNQMLIQHIISATNSSYLVYSLLVLLLVYNFLLILLQVYLQWDKAFIVCCLFHQVYFLTLKIRFILYNSYILPLIFYFQVDNGYIASRFLSIRVSSLFLLCHAFQSYACIHIKLGQT